MPGFSKAPRGGSGGAPGKAVLKGRMAKKKAAKPRSAKAQIRDLNRLLQKVQSENHTQSVSCV